MSRSFTRREVNGAALATLLGLAVPRGAVASTPVPVLDFAVAGGRWHGLAGWRDLLVPGDPLVLRPEPGNPHDRFAVAVHHPDGPKLGYVPRSANQPVADLLARGAKLEARVVGRLAIAEVGDIPESLAFTDFTTGDPLIRLALGDAGPEGQAS